MQYCQYTNQQPTLSYPLCNMQLPAGIYGQAQNNFAILAENSNFNNSLVQNQHVGQKHADTGSSLPPLNFQLSVLPSHALEGQPPCHGIGAVDGQPFQRGEVAVGTEKDFEFFSYLRKMAIPQSDKRVQFPKMLSQKFGEEVMEDGKLLSEDPNPEKSKLEADYSDDESFNLNTLKGERVDPQLRISQVDKILMVCDSLTTVQRHSLVSRRNTARLRLRQKQERQYQMLIRVDLDRIQRELAEQNQPVYPQITLQKPPERPRKRIPGILSWEQAKKRLQNKVSDPTATITEPSTSPS